MKNSIGSLMIALFFISCDGNVTVKTTGGNSAETLKKETGILLDEWHKAAAKADFDAYFSLMAEDGIYIGTDATENWNLSEFKNFSKPYFDKGKAWNFTALDRNIYLSDDQQVIWFDELLKTHMGLCRGSGVLTQEDGAWKIKHYVLSMTVPNKYVEEASQMKQSFDESYARELSSEKK